MAGVLGLGACAADAVSAPPASAPTSRPTGRPATASAARSAPLAWRQLDEASLERFGKWIEVHPHESGFRSIPWRTGLGEAIRASQTEDKPLLLWLYFGGPLGAC